MPGITKLDWPKILVLCVAGVGLTFADIFIGLTHGWLIALVLLMAVAGWLAAGWMYTRAKGIDLRAKAARDNILEESSKRLQVLEQRRSDDQRRMEILIRLNHCLAQAGTSADENLPDEQEYMNAALSALTELVDALGCSFVPVDDWQQPLPAFTHGRLPEPVLRAWANHLADGMLRERCGSCQILKSTPGGCPLHPEQIGNTLAVYCQPLYAGVGSIPSKNGKGQGLDRVLGILHLYMPAGKAIDEDTRVFLDVLLREIALGYESVHLRAQEQSTLRQIRLLNSPENDLVVSLGGLLDGLKQALDACYILVRLRPSADDRISNLMVERGELQVELPVPPDLFERVLSGESGSSAGGHVPVWLAFPMTLPEGRVSGMLFVAVDHPTEFHPRQKAILQAVAAQAALLIENDRLLRSLEYKVVIQERTRLAREIHDGLAQTLAYLKLQSAQMQTYLAQGDITRLANILKDNYQALADAYLDTRQAIDNLRLTPQEGITGWLERLVHGFHSATGVEAELTIEPSAGQRSLSVPLEIQAQLIRVVQETLSNVRKHARAQLVQVSLREWNNDLVLEIRDDGMGFESEDVPEFSRHGLRGMRERAELIGAEFQVISQRRKGTTVRLILPAGLEEGRPS